MSAMDLSKMGTARVALNTSDCDHIVIEKWPVSEVEWAFYKYVATELNQAVDWPLYFHTLFIT